MSLKIEQISSKQNPGIKNLLHLQKSAERKKQGLFVIEGLNEIEKAIVSGYETDSVYFCPEITEANTVLSLFKSKSPGRIYEINRQIFNKLAYRQDSGGIIVLAKTKKHEINNLKLPDNPLILVIEGIEKPGNIGAIYRTADAAGISAIIITDQNVDLYNPNAVRSSLGCVFTVPTATCEGKTAINYLKKNNIQIFSSYLQAAIPYHQVDYTKPSAIVMGTEATGITDIWVEASNANIIIPMRGKTDSMNVSTSAAVLIFEACRQRGFE